MRAIIHTRNQSFVIDTLRGENEAAKIASNDLTPMRRVFRKAVKKQAEEQGLNVRVPLKNPPKVILTPEARHATIRAAYNTSH